MIGKSRAVFYFLSVGIADTSPLGRLIRYYKQYYVKEGKTMSKIYEAKLVNDGFSDLENGKTVDGDSVRARMAEKYGV